MTESEWLTETDHYRHVPFVADRISRRQARLLAVAFCRAAWDRLDVAGLRAVVEVAERYADDAATRDELEDARQSARETAVKSNVLHEQLLSTDPSAAEVHHLRHELAWAVAFTAASPVPILEVGERVVELVGAAAGAVVLDLVGNPFRPAEFDPSWRTETVLALARQMYETREFSAMPILADALQDAGCHDDDVLNHCRSEGVHVRGCWVIDGVLGKA